MTKKKCVLTEQSRAKKSHKLVYNVGMEVVFNLCNKILVQRIVRIFNRKVMAIKVKLDPFFFTILLGLGGLEVCLPPKGSVTEKV